MSAAVPILARSRFQIFAFEVPRLQHAELETSLRHRVRSMTPLHDGQYRLWFHLERVSGGDWAYVFVTKPDQEAFRPEFPTRLPAGTPRDAVVTLATDEGPLPLLYRKGILREIGTVGRAPSGRWDEAARVEASPGWGRPPIPQSELRAEPFPWGAVAALVMAAAVLVAGLGTQWSVKVERNNRWKNWIAAHAGTKKPAADLEALRKAAGVPLDQVFSQLATAWPRGVLIRNLHLDGWKIDLEADSASGLASFQTLTSQPGFRSFVLAGVRALPDGTERLSAQGEWAHGK